MLLEGSSLRGTPARTLIGVMGGSGGGAGFRFVVAASMLLEAAGTAPAAAHVFHDNNGMAGDGRKEGRSVRTS